MSSLLIYSKMQNIPNDIIGIDTRLHFKKELGMKVHKLRVPDDLVEKLNSVMQYRRPPPPPPLLDIEAPLYDTSGIGIYHWPPQNNVTIVVSGMHQFSNNISYAIYVRKRQQVVLYGYDLHNGEWRCHVNKFPL
jgi:hypothetical protein